MGAGSGCGGAGEILLTSMDRDGTQSGFDCPTSARWWQKRFRFLSLPPEARDRHAISSKCFAKAR
jgi:hypothetical protein